jgi:hypothetical protein
MPFYCTRSDMHCYPRLNSPLECRARMRYPTQFSGALEKVCSYDGHEEYALNIVPFDG